MLEMKANTIVIDDVRYVGFAKGMNSQLDKIFY